MQLLLANVKSTLTRGKNSECAAVSNTSRYGPARRAERADAAVRVGHPAATTAPSRSSETETPAAGRPREVSRTWVETRHARSSSRSRAILAISPSAVSSSCSRVCCSRSEPQARIDSGVCSRTQTTNGKPKRSR